MNKGKIIGIVLGLIVLATSFLTVFGSSLKNLKSSNVETQSQDDTSLTTDTKDTKPTNTTVKKPIVKNDEDDSEDDDDDNGSGTTITPPTNTTTPPANNSTSFTMLTISAHNSATTCWSAVNGGVYDLTNWVNSHPGGKAAILMICGKDGSALFNTQHGGASKPASILAKYKIGTLK